MWIRLRLPKLIEAIRAANSPPPPSPPLPPPTPVVPSVPLPDRPIITLSEAANTLHSRIHGNRSDSEMPEVRSMAALRVLCERTDIEGDHLPIPIGDDNTLTTTSLHRLVKRIAALSESRLDHRGGVPLASLDRISLLIWMMGLDEKVVARPPKYAAKIDTEIKRIARLREPSRTLVACELLTRFCDAKAVARAMFELKLPADAEKIEARLDKLTGIADYL